MSREIDDRARAELREGLEAVRLQIEAAQIAAAAHGSVAKQARATLRAERLAGATLHRLTADVESRIADFERVLGPTASSRKDASRAWSEAEARLERAGREWVAEVERIRQSAASAHAQALARYANLLERAERGPSVSDAKTGDAEQPAKAPHLHAAQQVPHSPGPRAVHLAHPVSGSAPVREANRQSFHEQVQVQVDGEAAFLVDLSVRGAQVVSRNALRPNRAVRIVLPIADKPIACKGQVVWARIEPASDPGSLRYRAGMLFTSADETAIAGFMTHHSSSRRRRLDA